MAYLKQRLETLLGHEVRLHVLTNECDDVGMRPGELGETGEDFVGIWIGRVSYLVLIAHIIHIEHNTQICDACNTHTRAR